MAENEIIAGLDLGTTKVCAIVAEQSEEGLDIIGIGSVPSKGLKKGVVVNIESTVQSIQRAVEEAELGLGRQLALDVPVVIEHILDLEGEALGLAVRVGDGADLVEPEVFPAAQVGLDQPA